MNFKRLVVLHVSETIVGQTYAVLSKIFLSNTFREIYVAMRSKKEITLGTREIVCSSQVKDKKECGVVVPVFQSNGGEFY